jgi:hypothetical protein
MPHLISNCEEPICKNGVLISDDERVFEKQRLLDEANAWGRHIERMVRKQARKEKKS